MGARTLIAIAAAAVAACTGPDPSATVRAVAPSPQPGHERVTVDVANSGRHGEVTLELTLRGRTGAVIRETRNLEMDGHQRLSLVIDVAAPLDTYAATVVAKYPD